MNVQELLTYVEELTFKSSMLGYDKDEVDIQLDKICDEIEKIVREKDEEIAALKKGAPIEITAPAAEETKEAEDAAEESGEIVLQEEVSETDTKADAVQLEAVAADALKRAEAAEAQLADAQGRIADLEADIEDGYDSKEELESKLYDAKQRIAELETELMQAETFRAEVELREAQAEKAPAAAANTSDDAYQQYLRNADLLCQQLAVLQDKEKVVTADAEAKANQITAEAQVTADRVTAEAQAQADQIIKDAQAQADQIVKDASDGVEQKRAELAEMLASEQKSYDTMVEQKNAAAASLSRLAADIQALIAD